MSKKCPKCESKDIHITEYPAPTDNMATCYGCGYADLADRFPEQTVFDRIAASPETLAPNLVYWTFIEYDGKIHTKWMSTITEEYIYDDEPKAIAAAMEKLKEISNGG